MPEEIPGERDAADVRSGDKEFALPVASPSQPRFDYVRMGAGVFVGLAIVSIVLFSVTDVASVLVPMRDAYLSVLTPTAQDDSGFPFVLNALNHQLEGNTLSVSGRVTNNSTEAVENVLVVIDVEETTGRFPATLEIPVDPSVMEPGDVGDFAASVTLRQKPITYNVRFRLTNGPFVPHRDERGFGFETVLPSGEEDSQPPVRIN